MSYPARKANWLIEFELGASPPVCVTTALINSYYGKDRAAECAGCVKDGKVYTYVRLGDRAYDSEMARLAEHIETVFQVKNVKMHSFEGHGQAAEHEGMKILLRHLEDGQKPTSKFFKMVVNAASAKPAKRAAPAAMEQNKRLKMEIAKLKADRDAWKKKYEDLEASLG